MQEFLRARGSHTLLVLACVALAVAEQAAPSSNPQYDAALTAEPEGPVHFFEPFRKGWSSRWVNSSDGKYNGEWHWAADFAEIPGDYGLQMSSPGRLHAIAAPIERVIKVQDENLVIQFEMKATNGMICDGGYVKLLQEDSGKDLAKFDNDARYTIMFGPDRCGTTDKVHFILQHQNPVSKKWEEKHAQGMPMAAASDRMTHLYTLVIRKDNSFEVLVDLESKKKGSLLQDMEPPVNPPKEIDDPKDFKPSDWVDEEMMVDPDATKPDDWDETLPEMIEDPDAKKPSAWMDDEKDQIPDPKAKKPADWDDEEDGDWEAPLIANPKCAAAGCGVWKPPKIRNPAYKGKWYPPKIKNPAYKGVWRARKIPNEEWFEDLHPHNVYPISAVGFELLTNSGGLAFDNLLITSSEETARSYALKTWAVRNKVEKAKKPSTTGINGFINKYWAAAKDLYEDQPILAFALIGVFALLLVMIIFICCMSGKSSDSRPSYVPREDRKKTDEPEDDDVGELADPDDAAADSAAAAAADEIVPEGSGKPKKKGSRKAD